MSKIQEFIATAKINPNEVGIPTVKSSEVLSGVLQTVYVIGGIAAVVVIIVAGILYTTSNGNAERIKRAREAIVYAIVGLVVIMMAFVITNFVVGSF